MNSTSLDPLWRSAATQQQRWACWRDDATPVRGAEASTGPNESDDEQHVSRAIRASLLVDHGLLVPAQCADAAMVAAGTIVPGIQRAFDASAPWLGLERPRARRHASARATRCYIVPMSLQPEISQRDLRLRSKEIMDSVERGQAFTVTRDGHQIGELVPLRRRRTFVPRGEFLTSAGSGVVDPARFRSDLDAVIDGDVRDAYDR